MKYLISILWKMYLVKKERDDLWSYIEESFSKMDRDVYNMQPSKELMNRYGFRRRRRMHYNQYVWAILEKWVNENKKKS